MLNFRTNTFVRLRQDMDSLAEQDLLTPEKVKSMVEAKGIDKQDFKDANNKFEASGATYGDLEGDVSGLVAPAYTAFVEGLGKISKTIIPKPVTNAIENTAEVFGEYVPDAVKSAYQGMTDPYVEEGSLKEFILDTNKIMLGGGALLKVGKKAFAGSSLAPSVGRFYNKLGRKAKFATRNSIYGIPFATAQTIV